MEFIREFIKVKKSFAIIMGIILTGVIGVAGVRVYASQPISGYRYIEPYIFYKGEALDLKNVNGEDIKPINYKDTTYLPIRAVADALGLEVFWYEDIKTVHLATDDYIMEDNGELFSKFSGKDKLSIKVNNRFLNTMDSNGDNVIEPFILDGVTYVPIRLISESLGYDVIWSGNSNSITIKNKEITSAPIKAVHKQSFIIDYEKNIGATFYIDNGKVSYDLYQEGEVSEVFSGEITNFENMESLFYFNNIVDGKLLGQYIYFIDKNRDVYVLDIPISDDYKSLDFSEHIKKVDELTNILDMYYVDNGIFFIDSTNGFYFYDFAIGEYQKVNYSYIPSDRKEIVFEEVFEDTTITFVGDIYLSDYVLEKYNTYGVDGVLGSSLKDALVGADIFMANQEFAFSNRGVKASDKQYTFRVDPKYSSVFTDMGIDIATLANNHALDFGTVALKDSFDTLDDVGILYTGAGKDIEEAKECKTFEVNGKTFGFLGASRVIPVYNWTATSTNPGMLTTYNSTALVSCIEEAKKECDFVSAYVHWGEEKDTTPETYQRTLAKEYIDAGADIVIGSHPHVLQGIEFYEGKPIVYSLGNFIFYNSINQTAIINTTVKEDGDVSLQILPCKAVNGQTYLVEDKKAKEEFFKYIEDISFGVEVDSDGYVSEK